ncbi:transcriptional regulator [Tyzzerella sp. An114]|uniref:MBOAT family O-acyltransferase n=1 Tax=Tyzzerella sp. An114 TaxID=1965545 RepID=UPI000B453523|nr:MBOAT family protein [Tyzzerella sp. An114]OUQ59535.1 transcriptional regulator [Tyzzerella sp. An114]
MVFSSIIFIFLFLPVLLGVYYIVPQKFRNIIMLIFSLVFYAWGEPVYIILMIYSIVFNYFMGLNIGALKEKGRRAKRTFIFTVIVNLFILGFFKYYDFFIDNINSITGLNISGHDLPLPIGLSFYTFQALSYIADVYKGKVASQKNIVSFGVYIAMFPQLVAGPIVQYSDIDYQLKNRKESFENFGTGSFYFLWGLFKKVLLANRMGVIFESIIPLSQMSSLTAWIGALAYTFQIYFDFSGYSDMAIGLGYMFGFKLKPNFRYPYLSQSVTEFWRRWHISLGSWFREYVYIPLGGNRKGVYKHIRNTFAVWLLTGLWHGASWNFVVWGLYYGVILIIEKYFLKNIIDVLPSIVLRIYTMIVVIIGWVFFFSKDLTSAIDYIRVMFGFDNIALWDTTGIYYIITGGISLIICAICSTPLLYAIVQKCIERRKNKCAFYICFLHIIIFVVAVAYLVGDTYNPFLYFRF